MAHPLFGPEAGILLHEQDAAGMKAFCETLHPATVAEGLAGEFDVEEVWRFLSHADIKTQAAVFEYFPIEWQVKMVEGIGRERMAKLIEQMSHDDRGDLMRRLRPRVADELLRLVDEADRRDIASLAKYAANTAAALMTTAYAWLPEHITAGEAIDRLRLQAPKSETIYYVYVLDEQRKLLGVVSLADLIVAQRRAAIRDIMTKEVITVGVDDDREVVAQEVARYDLVAIPVVDAEGRLVGIVTHDDVIDVVEQEATEDVQRLGGVGTMTENYLDAGYLKVWRKRAVWLSCLFLAELLTFTALSQYDEAIESLVVLAMFVPLLIGTGGNSGSQAATLVIRAMAHGQVQARDWRRVLIHEIVLGIALGLTLGVIGFVRASATSREVLSNTETRKEGFQVSVPAQTPLTSGPNGQVAVPAGSQQIVAAHLDRDMQVMLPQGHTLPTPDTVADPGHAVYRFPENSKVSYQAVSRWDLAAVIAMAVATICLWGTLVGAMLPLIFRALHLDPAFASGPFVTTFVDVTGIVIYFNIALLWIPGLAR
jgi:magnesium transporter